MTHTDPGSAFCAFALGAGLELATPRSVEILARLVAASYERWQRGPEPGEGQVAVTRLIQALQKIARIDLVSALRGSTGTGLERALIDIVERRAPARVEKQITPERVERYIAPDRAEAAALLCKIGSDELLAVAGRLVTSNDREDVAVGARFLLRCRQLPASVVDELVPLMHLAGTRDEVDRARRIALALAHHGRVREAIDAVLAHPKIWHESMAELFFVGRDASAVVDQGRVAAMLDSEDAHERGVAARLILSLEIRDLVPRLREGLSRSDMDDDEHEVRMHQIVARVVADRDSIELVAEHARRGDSRATRALALSGCEDARARALELLFDRPSDQPLLNPIEREAACHLCSCGIRAADLAGLLWLSIRGDRFFEHARYQLECVGELSDPDVHDFLFRAAFDPPSAFDQTSLRLGAMMGLARHHPHHAVRAAIAFLLEPRDHREGATDVILRADPEHAAAHLIDVLRRQTRAVVRHAVCRALRGLGERAESRIATLFESNAEEDRLAACEVAGWLPSDQFSGRLKDASAVDLSWHVRRAAQKAIRRLSRHRWAREIHDIWRTLDNGMRWTLLDALLELVDPWLLDTAEDSLSLHRLLGSRDVLMWDYSEKQVEKRKADLKSELERSDRDG